MNKYLKYGCTVVASAAVIIGTLPVYSVKAQEAKEVTYIVNSTVNKKIEKEYGKAVTMSNENGNISQDKNLTTVTLTQEEAKQIKKQDDVNYVEKDDIVTASGYVFSHEKQTINHEKNKKSSEWNIQMINSKNQRKRSKKKVKVAVLDSGVDYGNDIDLAYTTTLVPEEEEINPLFMDGSGHGNSVAGLIAAKDNGDGITGVDPNVDIYSIRILDNNNKAPLSRVIEGIYMAIDKKVDIINMSFGIDHYSEALHQAIKEAKKAGILMVAAAGNTGIQGVQYPAAFDEVMAVGSVDKQGEISDTSAVGTEVEIVAPGELVRTTGELGDELVASGTSLAAPQVVGVAAKIWEENPSAKAEEIRNTLDASANLYGNREKYGNGLLDEEYALNHFQRKSAAGKLVVTQSVEKIFSAPEENCKKVQTFDETGCVKGSWSKNNHEGMVKSERTWVKKGARYPDEAQFTEKMHTNPWWHGYWKKDNTNTVYSVNYIQSYVYATYMAKCLYLGQNPNKPSKLRQSVYDAMTSQVNMIDWQKVLGGNPTKGRKRAFVWGMAVHSLADAFAHSTTDTKGNVIKHPDADDTTVKKNRFKLAKAAVGKSIDVYEGSTNNVGSYKQFSPVLQAMDGNADDKFKMVNIYPNMVIVAGADAASAYKSVNCSTK